MKQLLVDYQPFKFSKQQISESIEANDGTLIVSGILQSANKKNQNGRVYPKSILERECNKYAQNEIAQRRALGELDHPESSIVNLKNASHNILEVWWDGDDLYGKVEILDTPSGQILKKLFQAGITLGISSRGMGSVKQLYEGDEMEPTVEVQPDFELVCWDFVSNPSTYGAFMTPYQSPSNAISNSGLGEGKIISENTVPTQQLTNYNKAHKLITDIICELSGVCCI